MRAVGSAANFPQRYAANHLSRERVYVRRGGVSIAALDPPRAYHNAHQYSCESGNVGTWERVEGRAEVKLCVCVYLSVNPVKV